MHQRSSCVALAALCIAVHSFRLKALASNIADRRIVVRVQRHDAQERLRLVTSDQHQFEENKTAIKQHANSSQNIPGALILTADALAEAWIFKDGVRLTVEDVVTYLKSDIVQDMYEQTHNTIAQWIISNKRYIIPAGKLDMPNGNRAIGRHMTLKGVDVCAILHTEFKSMMQTKGLKLEGYLSWAAKNGKIVTAKDGRSYMNNVKFLVGGKSVQASCYVFPITQLNVIEETEDASELIIISETVDVDGTVSTVGTRMS